MRKRRGDLKFFLELYFYFEENKFLGNKIYICFREQKILGYVILFINFNSNI